MDDQRFQALMGLVEPQDMTSQQALAQQLRGQYDLGQLLSLSPTVGEFGRSMQQSALDTAQMAGTRRQQGLARARQAEQDRIAAERRALEDQRYEDELYRERQRYEDEIYREEERYLDERLAADALRQQEREQAVADAVAKHERALELQRLRNAGRAAGSGGAGGLTPSQLQTGLDKLEKKIKPMQDVTDAVRELQVSLAPYAVGGEKEGENIPGVGLLEGSRAWYGDAIRFMKGDTAQDIFRQFTSITSKKIKEDAGLAQTLTETQNVLKSLGQQEITSEESALQGLQELIRALEKDQARIARTTHPQVLEQYNRAFAEGEETPLTQGFRELDFSNRFADAPDPAAAENAIDARIKELEAKYPDE